MTEYTASSDKQDIDRRVGFGMAPRFLAGNVTPYELAVYVALSWYVDAEGVCWPGHRRVASEVGMSERQVRNALNGLRDKGLVSWEVRIASGGAQQTNLYRLSITPPAQGAYPPGTACPTPRHEVPTNKNQLNENQMNKNSWSSAMTDRAFAAFWEAYPRKVGKAAAQRAFVKAAKTISPEAIIAGAERYRDDPNRDAAFTAHPSTWLNAGRWDDEPLPPRPGKGQVESRLSVAQRAVQRLRDAEAAQSIESKAEPRAIEGGAA